MDDPAPPPDPRPKRPVPPLLQKTRDEFLRLCMTDKKYKTLQSEMLEAYFEATRTRTDVIKRRLFLWQIAETEVLQQAGYDRPKGTREPSPNQLTKLLREMLGVRDPTTMKWPRTHAEFMEAEEGDALERTQRRYAIRQKREREAKAATATTQPPDSGAFPPSSQNPPAQSL